MREHAVFRSGGADRMLAQSWAWIQKIYRILCSSRFCTCLTDLGVPASERAQQAEPPHQTALAGTKTLHLQRVATEPPCASMRFFARVERTACKRKAVQ
jgi:hypothetical protein